jgi:type II secretory pathway pseudopilin PulG
MLLMLNNKYRQRGIGLLELMLSLAIIALLLIMATRYYAGTKRSKEITEVVSLVNAIRAGASNYAIPGGYAPVHNLMTTLMNAGLLPQGSDTPPWGGDTKITATIRDTAAGLVITVPPPPTGSGGLSVCPLMAAQLNSGINTTPLPAVCASESGSLVVTYLR